MPQGTDAAALAERDAWLEPYCQEHGLGFCPRRHIEWFGPGARHMIADYACAGLVGAAGATAGFAPWGLALGAKTSTTTAPTATMISPA